MQDSEATRTRRFRPVVVALTIVFAVVAAVGCRSAGGHETATIELGRSVAIRPNDLTGTVAVLSLWDDRDVEERVDVYRVVSGRLPTVWPVQQVEFLQPKEIAMIRDCQVQHLSSWVPRYLRRIDGLWSVGVDGSVLTHEYRLGREEGVGWERATLVMRDGAGRRLWELSPSDIFPLEEQVDFEVWTKSYQWIVGVALGPDTNSVCVFARGGHFRTIGIRDGCVGKNIVDDYSYAR